MGRARCCLDEDAKAHGGGYFTLQRDGSRLYALWWNKGPDAMKRLHFRASYDGGTTFGPIKIINSAGGILPPYTVAVDGKGGIAIVYHDERDVAYHVYANISKDEGKTWLDEWRLDAPSAMTALEPNLVFSGDKLIATWKEAVKDTSGGVSVRVVKAPRRTEAKPGMMQIEIDRIPHVLSDDVLFTHGDSLYLVGQTADRGLIGYRSADSGKHWQTMGSLPESQGRSASQLNPAACGDSLCIVFTAKTAGSKLDKFKIYSAVITPAGAWAGAPVRVDRKPFDLTNSLNPDAASVDGAIMAAWEDYRTIRPSICLSYSRDAGRWRGRSPPAWITADSHQSSQDRDGEGPCLGVLVEIQG